MAASIYPEYPPDLTSEKLDYLVANIKDWSILHGLAVRPSISFVPSDLDPSKSLAVTAPVTLFPSLFSRTCFEQARTIQTAYNELYAAIASDVGWLGEVVEEMVEVDDFIAKLWDVHLAVAKQGYVQDLSLGLFRSDYMVHTDPSVPSAKPEIKQVEFNTIASSFGGLASKVSRLHQHLLAISAYSNTPPSIMNPSSLPPNNSIEALSQGLAAAHKAYGSSKSNSSKEICIVFVVQSPENNAFDQHALSDQLWTTHSIPNFRLPFSSVLDHTTVEDDNPSRPLIYHPPHLPQAYEVTTCYLRAGYSPDEYPDNAAWTARLQLERSAAVKCPTILTHLAGSKKIQQILATPSSPYLERFIARSSIIVDHQAVIADIRSTFAAIYPLDSSEAGKHAIAIATSDTKSTGYVLKPQREGGGNNIYGAKIPAFLSSLGDDEAKWRGHILMELIEPPRLRNSIFRNGEIQSGDVIGELGIFGACLWRSNEDAKGAELLYNEEAGWLLRTKSRGSEEGGVAAGFGSVDSVCLIDVNDDDRHSLSSTRAGKRSAEVPAAEYPLYPEPLFASRKRQRSSSVDISNTSAHQRSSFASLWNPTNTSIHSVTLPSKGRQSPATPSRPATSTTERPPIRKSKSLPQTPQDPPSGHSSLRVETSQQTSRESPASGDKDPDPEPDTEGPLHSPIMASPPTQHPADPELGKPLPPSTNTNATHPAEIPWGPSHPCYPHPNPHVPLSSPLHNTTRIIRIKRDWMIVGDLAPTFSNIYPEILEPWVSEADFRGLVQKVNEGLIEAFHPGGWRAWMDAVLGVATGWVWEDMGLTGVKSGIKNVERYIEEWNGRDSKDAEKTEVEGARVIPLRRTGYLSLDIQIPDPHVGLVDAGVGSKSSTRANSPKD